MIATAAARQLLTEFQPLVGGYSFSAVALGTIFGACDAPSSSKRPEGESAARERGGMSVAERLEAESAPRAHFLATAHLDCTWHRSRVAPWAACPRN